MKFPTGSTDKDGVVIEEGEEETELAERSIQPGSGSWDPIVGIYYLQRFGSVTGFGNATIRLPTEDEGYESGNERLANFGGTVPALKRLEALAQINMRFVGGADSAEETELFDQNTGGEHIRDMRSGDSHVSPRRIINREITSYSIRHRHRSC